MSRFRIGAPAALVLIVVVILAFAGWLFYRLESWPARTARQVRESFMEVANLQPKVTVHDRVYFEQTTSMLELTVASRETQVERETEFEWLGSKKRIKLRGVYRVKAGFDLTQPFTVEVENGLVKAQLPAPMILGVEQISVEVMALQNGIWNKISAADLEGELRVLPLLARQKATSSGLQKEALEMFSTTLRQKFSPEYQVEVKVRETLN